MIVARLHGGLGNQLFQYAVARALADRSHTQLLLDTRLCDPANHTAYALGAFEIRAKVAAQTELPPDKSRPLAYAAWRLFGRSPRHVRERGLGFDPSILELRASAYLHGYFQSEKYFAPIEGQLRRDLRLSAPLGAENEAAIAEIDGTLSVSMHLRRGDYVSSKKGAASHGTCTSEYYAAALKVFRASLPEDPIVYVFSDDPKWARQNVDVPYETRFFDHNGTDAPHLDLALIAACQHNIIANSTFSWWGAWLNPNPDKIVVAPKEWFKSAKLNNPEIVPEGWLRV